VRGRGLEPPWIAPLVPKTSASTNFATRAGLPAEYSRIFCRGLGRVLDCFMWSRITKYNCLLWWLKESRSLRDQYPNGTDSPAGRICLNWFVYELCIPIMWSRITKYNCLLWWLKESLSLQERYRCRIVRANARAINSISSSPGQKLTLLRVHKIKTNKSWILHFVRPQGLEPWTVSLRGSCSTI
jgi:hypothetical protein